MRRLVVSLFLSMAVIAVSCLPAVHPTPPPAGAPAKQVALSGASVMIGVGDIASCSQSLDEVTARMVDSVLRADSVENVNDAVFTLGDNVYDNGTMTDFTKCFTPSWGDPKKRIMAKIHPTPGNHDYFTPLANPYYVYFGARAGDKDKGYYSYDVGEWHAVAINSEMIVNSGFSAKERLAQETWLAQDLKASAKLCTVVYFHHPRFSSGYHGSDRKLAPLWQIMYDNNVDLVLSGHDHEYERFLPQTPAGALDTLRGIPEIVAGTGGEELRGFGGLREKNSAMQIEGRAGVLLLTLGSKEFRSVFLDVGGFIRDPSGGKCH